MPEQDDDALGDILSDRLKGTKNGDDEDEDRVDHGDEASEADESAASEDGEAATGEAAEASAEAEPSETAESAQRTQITDTDADGEFADGEAADDVGGVEGAGGDAADVDRATDADTEADDDAGTTRSRSPFPLYIRPSLKESVNQRFDRFNAERTLDDEPQVEKHAHFIQGLLRAGLDHPDLEEYVLEEFRED